MKAIIYNIIIAIFFSSLAFAQDTKKENLFHSYEINDFQYSIVLIDDRKDLLLSESNNHFAQQNYEFNLYEMNINYNEFILQNKVNYNSFDDLRLFCGPLEDGLYRNFDAKDIIIGSGLDYIINDVILKSLFKRN